MARSTTRTVLITPWTFPSQAAGRQSGWSVERPHAAGKPKRPPEHPRLTLPHGPVTLSVPGFPEPWSTAEGLRRSLCQGPGFALRRHPVRNRSGGLAGWLALPHVAAAPANLPNPHPEAGLGAHGAPYPAATLGRSNFLCLAQGCASPEALRMTREMALVAGACGSAIRWSPLCEGLSADPDSWPADSPTILKYTPARGCSSVWGQACMPAFGVWCCPHPQPRPQAWARVWGGRFAPAPNPHRRASPSRRSGKGAGGMGLIPVQNAAR